MGDKIDPYDLEALEKAVNDSAAKASVLWTSFTLFGFYIAITSGSVTHFDLFLDTPIKMPVLGVDLPITGYFIVAPIVYLIFQAYLLLQLLQLVDKAMTWQEEIHRAVPVSSGRRLMLLRLDDFPFLQFLAARCDGRIGILRYCLMGIAWFTLTAMPVIVLLQLQLSFLPDHVAQIAWIHRIAIISALALAWIFWIAIRPKEKFSIGDYLRHVSAIAVTFFVVVFSFFFAVFPGEFMDDNFVIRASDHLVSVLDGGKGLSKLLFEGDIDDATGSSESLFANRIILPGGHFFNESKHKDGEPSISLRGRNLVGAVLQNADLRYADFRGANLSDASLISAQLEGALFDCPGKIVPKNSDAEIRALPQSAEDEDTLAETNNGAAESNGNPKADGVPVRKTETNGAAASNRKPKAGIAPARKTETTELHPDEKICTNMSGADLTRAKAAHASFQHINLTKVMLVGADLSKVSLASVDLRKKNLQGVDLEGADLSGADLRGATINNGNLDGARLNDAALQGASLSNTSLRGANLQNANLQGAILNSGDLTGASINYGRLEGASLHDATLAGASMRSIEAEGADFRGADLTAARITFAQLQGGDFLRATIEYTDFNLSSLYKVDLKFVDLETLPKTVSLRPAYRPLLPRRLPRDLLIHFAPSRDLDEKGYRELVAHALEGVTDKPTQKRISDRLQVLDPDKRDDWSEKTAKKLMDTKSSESAKDKAAALFKMICERTGRPFVAQGILRNGGILVLMRGGNFPPNNDLVTQLKNANSCPGAVGLEDRDWERIYEFVDFYKNL